MSAAAVIVIKAGGEVVASERLGTLSAGVAALCHDGKRVVMVHGGGPQLSSLQERLGIPVRKLSGRRFTDEATLDVVKMTLGGKVNVDLCLALRRAGLQPVGLSGAVFAVRRPPRVYPGSGGEAIDLGLVGDVTGFDLPLLQLLFQDGRVPVLACLGTDPEGGALYNINADTVASALSRAIPADRLVLLSDVPVLRDVKDRSSRVPELTVKEAQALIDTGVAQGGMIAKLEEACGALLKGVREVAITADLGEETTILRLG